MFRRAGPRHTSSGEALLGTGDPGLHLWMVKPELIVRYERRRHELESPPICALQEDEVTSLYAESLPDLFR